MQSCKVAELECNFSVPNLKKHVLNYHDKKTRKWRTFVNLDNSICFYRRSIVFLCEDKLVMAKL